jgi:hypothetical protein
MTITRMQEPRQLYGLGSLVKKITKPIKKIIKSPIGKAAVLGLGGYALGGGFGPGGFAFRNIPGFTGAKNLLMGSPLGYKTAGDAVARSGGILEKFSNLGMGTKLGLGGAFASYLASTGASEEDVEEIKRDKGKLSIYLKDYFTKLNPNASDEEVDEFVTTNTSEYAVGGRVGFKEGKNMKMASGPDLEDSRNDMANQMFGKDLRLLTEEELEMLEEEIDRLSVKFMAKGGMPTGIMRTNQAGTIERDYRDEGGFVPVGIKEKADDVPAMLSKNEFVMTADAVRGMGNGSIEKGAQRLYDQMKRLENKVA